MPLPAPYVPKVKGIDLNEIYDARLNREKSNMLMEEMRDKRDTRNQLRATLANQLGQGGSDASRLTQAGQAIMGIDPEKGYQMIQAGAKMAETDTARRAKNLDVAAKLLASVRNSQNPALAFEQAKQVFTRITGEGLPDDLNGPYDPQKVGMYANLVENELDRTKAALELEYKRAAIRNMAADNKRADENQAMQRQKFAWEKDKESVGRRGKYVNVKPVTDVMGEVTGAWGQNRETGEWEQLPMGGPKSSPGVGGTPIEVTPPQSGQLAGPYGMGDDEGGQAGIPAYTPDLSIINQGGRAKGGHLNALKARVHNCGGRASGGYIDDGTGNNYTDGSVKNGSLGVYDRHPEYRTGDPLYDGTQVVHDSRGNKILPEMLAKAYRENPDDIPDSMYEEYRDVYSQYATPTATVEPAEQEDAGSESDTSMETVTSQDQGVPDNNALNLTVVGEKGPEVVLTPQGVNGYVLPITEAHANDLLKGGVTGMADGGMIGDEDTVSPFWDSYGQGGGQPSQSDIVRMYMQARDQTPPQNGQNALAESVAPTMASEETVSKAPAMFAEAQAKQKAKAGAEQNAIAQAMTGAGYANPEDLSRYNLTNFAGSSKQNRLASDAFNSWASSSKVGQDVFRVIASLAQDGYDLSGFGVTSANAGVHAKNSKHYADGAVDVNTKANQKTLAAFSERMAALGYSRGDMLGFGANEKHHYQRT